MAKVISGQDRQLSCEPGDVGGSPQNTPDERSHWHTELVTKANTDAVLLPWPFGGDPSRVGKVDGQVQVGAKVVAKVVTKGSGEDDFTRLLVGLRGERRSVRKEKKDEKKKKLTS
jgi:hypothetical protein